jgi:hypothetical protein
MKSLRLVAVLILIAVFIIAYIQMKNFWLHSCEGNWTYEGTFIGKDNFSMYCREYCIKDYNETNYKIEINGTENLVKNYCFCDVNKCGSDIINYSTLGKAGEYDYGSGFAIQRAYNVSLTEVEAYIMNTGTGNITLSKLSAYAGTFKDGTTYGEEPKFITNIDGSQNNEVLLPGEWAIFNVEGIDNPCDKLLKIILNSDALHEAASTITCQNTIKRH